LTEERTIYKRYGPSTIDTIRGKHNDIRAAEELLEVLKTVKKIVERAGGIYVVRREVFGPPWSLAEG